VLAQRFKWGLTQIARESDVLDPKSSKKGLLPEDLSGDWFKLPWKVTFWTPKAPKKGSCLRI